MALHQMQQALPSEAIDELRASIAGEILLPDHPEYDEARRLHNSRFDPHPSAIVYAAAESDVRHCLLLLRQYGVEFRVRSGGHSTAGYSASDGVLMDVSRLDQLSIDAFAKTAFVGCGCALPRFADAMERHGLHLPLGGGKTVRIGGYIQGGGWGMTSRIFGMTSDNAIEIRVMLADGRIVRANETTNQDLWWAVRGGTGGNFGVLLTVKFRLHETPNLTSWEIRWELGKRGSSQWLNEASALAALQQHYTGPDAPAVGAAGGIAPTDPSFLWLAGMFLGTPSDAKLALEPLLAIPGGQFNITPVRSAQPTNALLAGELTSVEIAANPWARAPWRRPSRFIDRPLAIADWQATIDHVLASPTPHNELQIHCYGGAIMAAPLDSSAFIHRGRGLSCFLQARWRTASQKKIVDDYLDAWSALVDPFWNGHIYQNFPGQEYEDYRWNYWGSAFPMLLAVKQKYDPDSLFAFPQMISPVATAPAGITAAVPLAPVARALRRPIADD